MDKLHREHEFIQNMWKFMKACEQNKTNTEEFWKWAEDTAEQLAHTYENMGFVPDWIASYLKFLEEQTC